MTTTEPSHRRRSEEEWRALLWEQRESGLSQRAFCKRKGLALSSFRNWKRRLTTTTVPAEPPDHHWLELPVGPSRPTDPGGHWDIELDLGNGCCLRLRQR